MSVRAGRARWLCSSIPFGDQRPTTMEYRVELNTFTGPIDLLLYLVRRHEVDVTDLPIAVLTDQFAQFLDVLEMIDFDFVGDESIELVADGYAVVARNREAFLLRYGNDLAGRVFGEWGMTGGKLDNAGERVWNLGGR